MVRVRAGIAYALTEAMNEGHCGLPADELELLASRLLEVPDDPIRTALELELAEGTVVADTVAGTSCVFLGGLYRNGIHLRIRSPDSMLSLRFGVLWFRLWRLPWACRATG